MLYSLMGLVASGPCTFPCFPCSRTLETTLIPARMGNAPVTPSARGNPNASNPRRPVVRLSIMLTVAGFLGVIAGAALIGRWALGLAIIGDSLALAAYGLLRETESRTEPSVHEVPSLHRVLERARAS